MYANQCKNVLGLDCQGTIIIIFCHCNGIQNPCLQLLVLQVVYLTVTSVVMLTCHTMTTALLNITTVAVTLNVFLKVTAAQMYLLYNRNAMVNTCIIILLLNNTKSTKYTRKCVSTWFSSTGWWTE